MKEVILAKEAALDALTPMALDSNGQGWASEGTPLPTAKKSLPHQPGQAFKLVSIPCYMFIRETLAEIFRDKPVRSQMDLGELGENSVPPVGKSVSFFFEAVIQSSEVLCYLNYLWSGIPFRMCQKL